MPDIQKLPRLLRRYGRKNNMKDLKLVNLKIRKGDEVKVLLGKDRGKVGKIVKVDRKEGKVLIEGINMFKRHIRKTQGIEGGVIDIIKPLKISNISLVCPKCKKQTRVGFKFQDNKKVRICKKCQEIIT